MTSSNGIKIGLIGLVEREWLDTINVLPPNLIYKSASATAEELVPGLREQGAEMIIAITHQREPNDNKLAETTSPGLIDLVLGGHDHYYQHSLLNGTHILRSGSDFKQLSYIEARRKADGTASWDFTIYRRDIVQQIPEDKSTVELVEKLTSALKAKLEKPVGYTAAPLDARFTTVRLKESNLGNFVCDLMRSFYQADCCIMAAGTVRGDQIYPPGVLKMKDIMNWYVHISSHRPEIAHCRVAVSPSKTHASSSDSRVKLFWEHWKILSASIPRLRVVFRKCPTLKSFSTPLSQKATGSSKPRSAVPP